MPVVFCDVVGSEGQNKAFSKKRKKAALESKSNQSEAHKVVGPVKYVMPAYVKCIVLFSNKRCRLHPAFIPSPTTQL